MRDAWKAACCLGSVGLLAADFVGSGKATRADRALVDCFPARRPGAAAARAVTRLGEPRLAFPAVAAVCAARLFRRGGGRLDGLAPLMTLACGAAVRRGICDAIARSRPPGSSRWEQPSGHSFPSKHTTTATLAAAAFAPQDVRLPMAAGALVGATRLYLGVHWPTDVAAGLLTGLGFLYAARAVQSD